jgi:hypothetical protein
MATFAQTVFSDTEPGSLQDLPRAGSSLENPYVYDATARELKAMAQSGLLEIAHEETRLVQAEPLIAALRFRRLR